MKSLAELEAIKIDAYKKVSLRTDKRTKRIAVSMDTCGFEKGARDILKALMHELDLHGMTNVEVLQTTCMGHCDLEPMIEVNIADEPKVVYVKLTEEKARKIVVEHLKNHQIVTEFTLAAYEK